MPDKIYKIFLLKPFFRNLNVSTSQSGISLDGYWWEFLSKPFLLIVVFDYPMISFLITSTSAVVAVGILQVMWFLLFDKALYDFVSPVYMVS